MWNLELSTPHAPIEHTLHAHQRAITDINFSAHHPDILATCAVDSFVHCWDLRHPARPATTFADFYAGATQVKWNRQDSHIIASSHDRVLRIWDDRKGAYPLRSIEAHATKIYGVDWNRTRATKVLTCSLDKTIKFWDYSKLEDEPERVIETSYPVWRARHTPFGWGVLAMPQREDFDLHLYDRRPDEGEERRTAVPPVCSFDGHHAQVKEFLWRSRGNIEDDIDNRDFQMISWGMDKDLRLHRIEESCLKAVGHEKGGKVRTRLNLTRRGAQYRTFRDEVNSSYTSSVVYPRQGLGALVGAAGMSKMPLPVSHGRSEGGFSTPAVGMQARSRAKSTVNPIKWMEGVTMGKGGEKLFYEYTSRPFTRASGDQHMPHTAENLGDEITYVGKKYKKVTFEDADINRRIATISLTGPWNSDNTAAFIRVCLKFPEEYPSGAVPDFTFEKTTSSISESTVTRLRAEIRSIAEHYLSRRRGCLEAIITYLLGERDLAESTTLTPPEDEVDGIDIRANDSSSDEEDEIGANFNSTQAQDMETSGIDVAMVNANANVPLPKACGAIWAKDGRLICFFPPKAEPKPLFSLETLRNTDRSLRNKRLFEGFGRLHNDSPGPYDNTLATQTDDDAKSFIESGTSSSSSSSSSSSAIDAISRRFAPPAAWRGASIRFQRSSQHSSAGHGNQSAPAKSKSLISVYDMQDLLPAKKQLAQEYEVFGDGPSVCTHNAEVARSHGYEDLAEVWSLVKLILYNEVPLEILAQSHRREPILVLATRALVRVKRKDSGLDLQFDEPEGVAKPQLQGRVKWGMHPFANTWLIPAL